MFFEGVLAPTGSMGPGASDEHPRRRSERLGGDAPATHSPVESCSPEWSRDPDRVRSSGREREAGLRR